MPKILNEKILSNCKIGEGIYKLTVQSDDLSTGAKPGQFVNIRCSEGLNTVLRRPISICDVDREAGTADIVYQVRGKGTLLLSDMRPGTHVNMIGPLGRGFDVSDQYRSIVVVGGGIGVFPLLYLLHKSKAETKKAFLGFRTKNQIVLEEEFNKASGHLQIATDDGSAGHHGLVTDLLEKYLDEVKVDVLYTCGPLPMMKKVVEMTEKRGVACQVSMEERMGCGIGACLVCACKTKYGDEWEYSHVCADGPVFWSHEVIF